MRKYLLFLLILISKGSFAQAPQSFKYQAVVRDAAGLLAVNKIISIRTSILSGSATGSSVYTEKQTLSTNDYGVVSLNIGAGTLVAGNFSTINWGASTYFVKTELDINGASTYVFMGTSQILSVPYALYAEKTGSSLSDHDTSSTNEIQNLSVVGSNLTISGGNTISLPPDADSNPLNELQSLSITGDSLHITNGNSIFLSGAVDLDASPLNEIQNLSLNGDSLKISMGNNVVFPHDNDRDSTNEIQNLSINLGTINISNGNSIHLPDSTMTNELQNLNINQGTISISNGNSIHIPDSLATNELQNLSIVHDSISISQGNTIYVNTTRSLKFPEGTEGQPLLFLNGFVNYTVPAGKNLYFVSFDPGYPILNSSNLYKYNGSVYGGCKGLPVIKEGETINGGRNVSAILVNKVPDIEIAQIVVTNLISQIIPAGKTFYLKSYRDSFEINSTNSAVLYYESEVIILPAGTVLSYSSGTSDGFIITGYYK